ncbi:MAG: exonuclease SbcCD subunit D C-terminal domain-containing protein [Candidatus Riflebacteria bacterium]|nr:exonuclease SbcCD subunit D C-terminal domain-containing protein [Candidatus Riflebacteria bacterium]
MKILHTSDWHLGRNLHGRKRYDEFSAFLDWLLKCLEREKIDVLLVAGDIFDNTAPTSRSQELYFGFLGRVAKSCCRHVVIVAGNHDSASLLDAAKPVLAALNVHVIGVARDNPADEVFILNDAEGLPMAVVAAVPYLRDRDLRTAVAGENADDKSRKLVVGLQHHYAEVCLIAEEKRQQLGEVPVVATGHLFAAGGKTLGDDGVRELYVGNLAYIGADVFPESIDYLALGHLHIAQTVAGREYMRYSGSPLPMGFGEAAQTKKVVMIDFAGRKPEISEIDVPCFQALVRIKGSLEQIVEKIGDLKKEQSTAWLEIECTSFTAPAQLKDAVDDALAGSGMEKRLLKNADQRPAMDGIEDNAPDISDLAPEDVFNHCLDAQAVPSEKREILLQTYREAVQTLVEHDASRDQGTA